MKRFGRSAAAGVWLALVGVAIPVVGREPAKLVPEIEAGHDDARDLDYEVTYLQLEGLGDEAVQAKVNGSLRRMSLAAKKLMLIHLKTWEKPEGWDLASMIGVSMSVGLNTGELLSVSQSIDNYFAGAAHPNLQLRVRTFDLTTGTQLHLKHIFRPGSDAALAERIDTKLRTIPDYQQDGEYFLDTPTADDIDEAMLGKDGVTFLFSPYKIGPYVAGPVVVELSYAELDGLLVEDGPVARQAAAARAAAPAAPAAGVGVNQALGEPR